MTIDRVLEPGSTNGGVAFESAAAGGDAGPHGRGRKPLGLAALVVLIFYNVSGGPFGSEDAVGVAGPFWAILGFLVFPLIWSVPEALVTAELATAFPCDAGYVSWVTAAFGPFWGFQEGVLSWISGSMDNAIYPGLFVRYLEYVVCPQGDGDNSGSCPTLDAQLAWFMPSLRSCIIFAAIGLLSYLNFRGLEFMGKIAVGLTAFVLTPFVILCALGAPRVRPSAWLARRPLDPEHPEAGVDWVTLLNVLFWNLNYWDTASTLAGEVAEPERTFPRALSLAVVMVATTYVVPLAVCSAALPEGQAWDDGYFAQAGYLLGGRTLQYWILASAAVSNMGQFMSEQASNAHQLLGMAQLGHLPSCFAVRNSHGTPVLGLALSVATSAPLATLNMESLVAMLNGVYCLAELLEFAAFLRLRWRFPQLRRPYRVPLGLAGCSALLAAPSAMCVVLILLPLLRGQKGEGFGAAGCTLGSVALGLLLYGLLAVWRQVWPQAFSRGLPTAQETMEVLCGDCPAAEDS